MSRVLLSQRAPCGVRRLVINCLKSGSGFRDVLRITGVAVSTQIRWAKSKFKRVCSKFFKQGDIYEVDEMRTYVGKKTRSRWIISAKSRSTGEIVALEVGRRTKNNLKKVIDTLLLLSPKAIYTDGLKEYKFIIPNELHKVVRYGTNHLERFHLTMRTHLKRLNRRTICYSKSEEVLEGLVKSYVWD